MKAFREPSPVLPAAVVAGNLAVFLAAATALTTGRVTVTHHWLFLFHEGLLLVQALILRPPWAVRSLAGLSVLVLAVAAARIETIWLAHHMMHFAIAFAGGAILHAVLSRRPVRTEFAMRRLGRRPGAPWRRFNRMFAAACAATALASGVAAIRQGIWWGLAG